MDPRDTPEEAKFRKEVRTWLDDHVQPYRDRYRNATSSLDRLTISAEWQGELYRGGFGALGWPEEYGGRPASHAEKHILGQELGEVGAPWHLNMTVTLGYSAGTVLTYAPKDFSDEHIPRILRGEEIWCQLFSEPNAGSDLASVATSAERVDGEYVVNGQKIWSSGAHWAKWGILLARTDPKGPRYHNLSFFVVDMSSDGIEPRPITQINGERDFCEVFFTDVRIPAEQRLSDEGMGWQVAVFTLINERLALSGGGGMSMLGRQGWQRLVDTARRGGRLDDPRVRQMLGQIYVEGSCARWTGMRAISTLIKGGVPGPESSVIKLSAELALDRMTRAAGEILGPYAVVWEGERAPDEGAWANAIVSARAFMIGGGTTEVQKNIVGERVLGLPKEPRPG